MMKDQNEVLHLMVKFSQAGCKRHGRLINDK